MLEIIPTEASEVKRIACPDCGERLPRVGLKRNSRVDGLTFSCGKCKKIFEIKSK